MGAGPLRRRHLRPALCMGVQAGACVGVGVPSVLDRSNQQRALRGRQPIPRRQRGSRRRRRGNRRSREQASASRQCDAGRAAIGALASASCTRWCSWVRVRAERCVAACACMRRSAWSRDSKSCSDGSFMAHLAMHMARPEPATRASSKILQLPLQGAARTREMGLDRALAATHRAGRLRHVKVFQHAQGEGFALAPRQRRDGGPADARRARHACPVDG